MVENEDGVVLGDAIEMRAFQRNSHRRKSGTGKPSERGPAHAKPRQCHHRDPAKQENEGNHGPPPGRKERVPGKAHNPRRARDEAGEEKADTLAADT